MNDYSFNWPSQYDKKPKMVDDYKADYCTPIEGFMPGQAESLSTLVRRLSIGQAVPMVSSGVYGEDQLFESELMDKFDVMDRESDLRTQVSRRPERAAEDPKPSETPPPETPPQA